MKAKAMTVILCPLLVSGTGAAEDIKDMGKQAEIRSMQEDPFKKAMRIKNEVLQLQQNLKGFVSAYEEKKISLEQLRNFYEKRVKSFCLYYHKLSGKELAVLLDAPSRFMNLDFLWDMRVRLNDLTEIFLNEDQGESVPFTGRNYSYTGPREVVALKVFSDEMDNFLEWMKIFEQPVNQRDGWLLIDSASFASWIKFFNLGTPLKKIAGMKTKAMAVILCSLLASGAGAAEDVKDMGKQTGIRSMLENPVKKAARVKNEAVQLQQDLKRFVSAYEAKKISLEQLRNFYEKRVKSFCLYHHELSKEELGALFDLPPVFYGSRFSMGYEN